LLNFNNYFTTCQ